MMAAGSVKDALDEVRQRIGNAAQASGRKAEDVQLVVVSKWVEQEAIAAAFREGVFDFGENYIQELQKKAIVFPDIRWHMIGQVQKNKVKYMPGNTKLIQSLDDWDVALEIDKRFAQAGMVADVLIQVNIGNEPQKAGIASEDVALFAERVQALPCVNVQGLMAIPPAATTPEGSRPFFTAMKRLYDQVSREIQTMRWLSMGMSADYEVAIEEGTNMVRVGSSIFGARVPGNRSK